MEENNQSRIEEKVEEEKLKKFQKLSNAGRLVAKIIASTLFVYAAFSTVKDCFAAQTFTLYDFLAIASLAICEAVAIIL